MLQCQSLMKVFLLAAALAWVSTPAFGQGQIFFTNRDFTSGVNARFALPGDAPGTSSVGFGFQAQIFGGPEGTPMGRLVPLDPSSTVFRGPAGGPLAGYLQPVVATIPGVNVGDSAEILVRVFNGLSWATASFRYEGAFSMMTTSEMPPTVPLGASPIVLVFVPEPSSAVLVALGMAVTYSIRVRSRIGERVFLPTTESRAGGRLLQSGQCPSQLLRRAGRVGTTSPDDAGR